MDITRWMIEEQVEILLHIEETLRTECLDFSEGASIMAEFIRTSYVSLHALPEGYWYVMHQMYEDTDLDGANEAEAAFDFLEKQVPGSFVGILANDSVTPPCCNSEGHYHCDHYAPYWYTVLIAAPIWEQYKAQVEAKHQAYVMNHVCLKPSGLSLAVDREE